MERTSGSGPSCVSGSSVLIGQQPQWQTGCESDAGDDRGDPATPRQRESSIGCTERTPRASRGSMLFTYH